MSNTNDSELLVETRESRGENIPLYYYCSMVGYNGCWMVGLAWIGFMISLVVMAVERTSPYVLILGMSAINLLIIHIILSSFHETKIMLSKLTRRLMRLNDRINRSPIITV